MREVTLLTFTGAGAGTGAEATFLPSFLDLVEAFLSALTLAALAGGAAAAAAAVLDDLPIFVVCGMCWVGE